MNQRSSRRFPGTSGFTLMEVGLILGVIAVLSVGVITASGFINASRVSGTIQMINTVQLAAREFVKRANRGQSFANITNATLADENLLPADLKSPFDTAVTIASYPPAEPVPDGISIKFRVPDQETCFDLRAATSKMAKWPPPPANNCFGCNNCEIILLSR